jgi:hypothetical protein
MVGIRLANRLFAYLLFISVTHGLNPASSDRSMAKVLRGSVASARDSISGITSICVGYRIEMKSSFTG